VALVRPADGALPARDVQSATMRSPTPLELCWRRSRVNASVTLAACGATALLWLALPLPFVVRIVGGGLAVAAAGVLWRDATGPRAPLRLTVGLDRRIVAATADGAARSGVILSDSCVWPRVTTIVWRPDGERRARTLLVTTGNLGTDDFRRLRVFLRYARAVPSPSETSGAVAG